MCPQPTFVQFFMFELDASLCEMAFSGPSTGPWSWWKGLQDVYCLFEAIIYKRCTVHIRAPCTVNSVTLWFTVVCDVHTNDLYHSQKWSCPTIYRCYLLMLRTYDIVTEYLRKSYKFCSYPLQFSVNGGDDCCDPHTVSTEGISPFRHHNSYAAVHICTCGTM